MTALSVILTTYNKPQDLERALEGFRQQALQDFELLVCDDGSGPETQGVVERFRSSVSFPVHHLWQEDKGFRAARSRNNGARQAQGETLVFVDGDCVPTPQFLSQHAALQRRGLFLVGERFMLAEEEGAWVTVASIASGRAFSQVPRRELRRLRSVRWKNAFYRFSGLKPHRPRLLTSNCSMARSAFLAVNGFDERYEGWGLEDEDLRRRLVNQGLQAGSVIGQANCLHLWHPTDPSQLGPRRLQPNWAYFDRGFQLSRCRLGLEERSLPLLNASVRGPESELVASVRAALRLGAYESAPPELELLIDPGPPSPPPTASGQAEITVLLSAASPRLSRATAAQLVLAPGVPRSGGELPGAKYPPVPPQLARLGVLATRPLPAPLDAKSLRDVRAALDELL